MVLTSRYDVLSNGDKAIYFSLLNVDGKLYSLDDFTKAKALLIIFMCNHCPYVKPKMSYFVELQKKYSSKSLQLVGINSNDPTNYPDDDFEGMKKISNEKGFNFPYLFDETQETAKKYGAVCTPDPYLFNQKKELVYHGRFDDAHGKPHAEAKTKEMEDAIDQLLSNGIVKIETLPSMGCSIKWK